MPFVRVAALALALLSAGCAFRRGAPLPADPPPDFALSIVADGAATWPWDGRMALLAGGTVDYAVTFRDPPSTRRGCEPLDPAERAGAWAAVVAAGFFDREPVPKGWAAGPVIVEGRALGLEGRWSGDPSADGDLAALLDALRSAAPPRVFRPIPPTDPPR